MGTSQDMLDLLDGDARVALLNEAARRGDVVPISALTGAGLEALQTRIGERLTRGDPIVEISSTVSACSMPVCSVPIAIGSAWRAIRSVITMSSAPRLVAWTTRPGCSAAARCSTARC